MIPLLLRLPLVLPTVHLRLAKSAAVTNHEAVEDRHRPAAVAVEVALVVAAVVTMTVMAPKKAVPRVAAAVEHVRLRRKVAHPADTTQVSVGAV